MLFIDVMRDAYGSTADGNGRRGLSVWFTLELDKDSKIRDLKREMSKKLIKHNKGAAVPEKNLKIYNKPIVNTKLMTTNTAITGGPSGGGNLGNAYTKDNLDSGIPLEDDNFLAMYEFSKVRIEFGGEYQPSRIFMM